MSERRRFYAEEVAAVAGIDSPRMVEAFASVPREAFLGPGPWEIVLFGDGGARSYRRTPDADPAHVLHNVVVAIDPARNLNNGQPGALATWIASLEVQPGDSVLHVGAGVGYYTAILAEMAARVTAIEIDPALAEKARANLAAWRNVEVFAGDGRDTHGKHDAILVNAGATHPLPEWLDALKPGGRLLVPLTVPMPGQVHGTGLQLLVCGDTARFTTPLQIFDCAGARDPSLEPVLKAVLLAGKWRQVRKLRRDAHEPGPACVLHTAACCLASE
jgi:protein-L-isoaspartate(D-aspartate) O-methyltransferase